MEKIKTMQFISTFKNFIKFLLKIMSQTEKKNKFPLSDGLSTS